MKIINPTDLIRKHLPELRYTCKVSRVGIFGSFARDDATESSDVDILVEFSQNVGLFHRPPEPPFSDFGS
ncbi:MAG: nucleotidyltransferase domain-containing protein [Syntrophomonadaceae bacterium]